MSEIIRLHHEDWDYNKLFGELKSQGLKSVKLQLPAEWEADEKMRTEKVTELLRAAEAAGVNIQELVPHTVKSGDSSAPTALQNDGRSKPRDDGGKLKFGPGPIAGNGHIKFFLGLGIFLIILVVAGGIVLSQKAFREQRAQLVSPVASLPTLVPTPSPTPTPVLNREDLTIRVLNGSGERGAAGNLARFLEGLGYSVSITGNTNVQAGSKLRLKTGSEVYREILAKDLEPRLTVSSGSALPAMDVVGAEIIIGN